MSGISQGAGGGAARGSYDALVFDWDGTLVDSTTLIAEAILHAADTVGVPVRDRGLAAHVIGLGMADALARVVPDLPPPLVPEFVAHFQAHYRQGEGEIRFFEGIRPLLETLQARGVLLAVATGKSQSGLARSLQMAGLEQVFAATRCADQTQPKPHPAMLQELAAALEREPRRMLMIGDTSHDLQMAAAAGVDAVGVSYGAHPRSELERLQPLAVFDAVAQLRDWVLART